MWCITPPFIDQCVLNIGTPSFSVCMVRKNPYPPALCVQQKTKVSDSCRLFDGTRHFSNDCEALRNDAELRTSLINATHRRPSTRGRDNGPYALSSPLRCHFRGGGGSGGWLVGWLYDTAVATGAPPPPPRFGVALSTHASQLPLSPAHSYPSSPCFGPLAPAPAPASIAPRTVPVSASPAPSPSLDMNLSSPFSADTAKAWISSHPVPSLVPSQVLHEPAPPAPTAETTTPRSHAGPHIVPTGQRPSCEFLAPALPGMSDYPVGWTTSRTSPSGIL